MLQAQTTEVAAAMATAVLAEVPIYRQLDGPALKDYQAGLARSFEAFLAMVATGATELAAPERAWLRAVGAERAARGFPLEAVRRGPQVAMRVGWRQVATTVWGIGEPSGVAQVLTDLPLLLVDFVAQLDVELVVGYQAGLVERERDRTDLLADLLAGSFHDDEGLLLRAAAAGLNLTGPHGLLVVTGPGRAAEVARASQDVVSALPEALAVPMTASHPPHVVVLVPADGPAARDAVWLAVAGVTSERHAVAVLANWCTGPTELHRAYRQASEVLDLALIVQTAGLVDISDLLADRCLQFAPMAALHELVDRTLGPLLRLSARDRSALVDTLWALHRHASAAEAAVALGVHVKTVRYRWTRIRELTGLDLDRPTNRFRLEVAMHASRLIESDSDSSADRPVIPQG
ncbi:MAG: PucR family transcriptional regulator [Mycobacteriales bacterium]